VIHSRHFYSSIDLVRCRRCCFGFAWLGHESERLPLGTKRWARVHTTGKSPEPRWGHAALVYLNKMYIFGGCDNLLNFKEVHKFHFGSLSVTVFP
jgi:hypothetical protein